MAVIKANYVRRGKVGNAKAKENARYIQHRPDKDNERVMRPLFTNDSPMTRLEAYQFIDDAPKGTHFYTIIINPDPSTEDTYKDWAFAKSVIRIEKHRVRHRDKHAQAVDFCSLENLTPRSLCPKTPALRLTLQNFSKDLDMRQIAITTMQSIEDIVKTPLSWVAAIHDDHTDKNHVHALAAINRRLDTPELNRIRDATTQACLEQRRELDRTRGQKEQERGGEEWELEPTLEEDTWEK